MRFVAIANIDDGGHYTTVHEIDQVVNIDSPAILLVWLNEMVVCLGCDDEIERILDQGSISIVDSISEVGRSSFCFGSNDSHCIVVFVSLS